MGSDRSHQRSVRAFIESMRKTAIIVGRYAITLANCQNELSAASKTRVSERQKVSHISILILPERQQIYSNYQSALRGVQ